VYFNRCAANAKPRIETRYKTGAKVNVRLRFLEGRLHLPILQAEKVEFCLIVKEQFVLMVRAGLDLRVNLIIFKYHSNVFYVFLSFRKKCFNFQRPVRDLYRYSNLLDKDTLIQFCTGI
jgi:hypothetical protein